MVESKAGTQLRGSRVHNQLGSMLYLLGALLLTAGSFFAVQAAPEILLNGLVLGTFATLFIIYSFLGLYLSQRLGAE
jgi:hypothetical protein